LHYTETLEMTVKVIKRTDTKVECQNLERLLSQHSRLLK